MKLDTSTPLTSLEEKKEPFLLHFVVVNWSEKLALMQVMEPLRCFHLQTLWAEERTDSPSPPHPTNTQSVTHIRAKPSIAELPWRGQFSWKLIYYPVSNKWEAFYCTLHYLLQWFVMQWFVVGWMWCAQGWVYWQCFQIKGDNTDVCTISIFFNLNSPCLSFVPSIFFNLPHLLYIANIYLL